MNVGSFGPGSSPSGSARLFCGEFRKAHKAAGMASITPRWIRCLFLNTVLSIFGFLTMSTDCATAVEAVEIPPVRLRLELLSIRNRSASPVPVKVKLEYNDPKILQGDLELLMYDGREAVSDDDLRATMRFPDITLSGTDYTFHALLPPVSTSTIQNLAVLAWFHSGGKRIPLSSSVKEIDPPVPHDLLMISPNERGTLVCSCRASGNERPSRPAVKYLEDALSLENYNPVQARSRDSVDSIGGDESRTGSTNAENADEQDSVGAHIQYYAVSWSASDLPVDPLAYCSFDLVLLADGGLGAASVEQMQALALWVKGGGSVCIVPDTPLKSSHLEFVRNLTSEMSDESGGAESAAGGVFELNEQGQLLLDGAAVSHVVLSRAGLGRVAVLPAVDDLKAVLPGEILGRLVGFLWKIRRDVPIHEGKKWALPDLQAVAKEKGLTLNKDEIGWYLDFSQVYSSSQLGRNALTRMRRHPVADQNPANCYFDEDQLLELLIPDGSYAPGTETILENSALALLPADVAAVPAWLIGLILAAYVVTIGPVDYFVLGFFRLRKATWVLFPVVTFLFTMLTIAAASSYLGSTDTGGSVTVTDVIRAGVPIRRTGITMSFLGARATVKSEHRSQLVVHACEARTAYRPQMQRGGQNVSEQILNRGTPMHYQGRFPQSYQASHPVQQWSPQLVRSFEFTPTDAEVPKIDWQDTSLITTPEGRAALGKQLKQQVPKDVVCSAVVLRPGQEMMHVLDPDGWELFGTPGGSGVLRHSWLVRSAILETTWNSRRNGFFRLAATVSPQGSAVLEDLRLMDFSDSSQWALVIILQQNNTSRVFRKLYHIKQ